MVVGYYDTKGYGDLFLGDASTQTTSVNQGIASEGSGTRGTGPQLHYEDYSLPMDSPPSQYPNILNDNSATYPTNCHTDNCVADFMHTSWSKDRNRYGWSWADRIGLAFKAYIRNRKVPYIPEFTEYRYGSSLSWDVIKQEIDANRPMVFLVDSTGNGSTDHFVTVIGYKETPTSKIYGYYDTWSTSVQEAEFRGMSSSYQWGVWGGWSFRLKKPLLSIRGFWLFKQLCANISFRW